MDVFVYCIYDMHAYFLRYVYIVNIGLHTSAGGVCLICHS